MRKKARVNLINDNIEKDLKVEIDTDDNRLIYKEDETTEVLYDIKEEKLIRENKYMYLEISFKEEISTIYLKEEKKSLNIKIDLEKLEFSDNKLEIIYMIEGNRVVYKIEIEK